MIIDLMIRHANLPKFLSRLGSYYLTPHELLHVLAYCLIGKRCHYRWGDDRVLSLQAKSRGEKLFILYSGTARKDLLDAYGWLFIYQAEHDGPEPEKQAYKSQGSWYR